MRFRTFLGAFTLLALSAKPVLAYCPPNLDYSLRGEFRRADIVAIVKVKSVTWLDEHRRPVRLRRPLALGDQPGGRCQTNGASVANTGHSR